MLSVQRHQRAVHQGMQPRTGAVGHARVGGRDIGGGPAIDEPVVQRRAVGVDHVRASDVRSRQSPNNLRGKQLPAVRVGGGQFLQIDASTAVAAADPVLATVGPGHRPAQPQRRSEQIAYRVRHLGPRSGQHLGDEFSGQLIMIRDRDVARVGNHRFASRIGEVQGVAFVGRLKLLPVQEDAVGQAIDSPATGRLDQRDRSRVRQFALRGLEHSDIGQRTQDIPPHRRRNTFGSTGFNENHMVDQQRATGIVPRVRGRLGEELPRRQMPVGRVGRGLQEFAQQHVGIHTRGRFGQIRRCRVLHRADRLRCRRAGHPRTAGEQRGEQHQPRYRQEPPHPKRSTRRARVVADARWVRAQAVPGSLVPPAELVSWATGWW